VSKAGLIIALLLLALLTLGLAPSAAAVIEDESLSSEPEAVTFTPEVREIHATGSMETVRSTRDTGGSEEMAVKVDSQPSSKVRAGTLRDTGRYL
jgi:hypothetical protein